MKGAGFASTDQEPRQRPVGTSPDMAPEAQPSRASAKPLSSEPRMSNRLFTLYGANARGAFFIRETTPGLSSKPRGSADVAAALLCAKCDRQFW